MFIDCVKRNPKCNVHSTGISTMVVYHNYILLYFNASLLYKFIDYLKLNPKCFVHSTGISIMVAY